MNAFAVDGRRVRFGLVLPHFGEFSDTQLLLDVARDAEEAGFESLWARDRIRAGAGHGLIMEGNATRFLEPFVSLSLVAAVTHTIGLGTAVLAPTSHPLKLAQQVGSLSALSHDRFILGIGAGAVKVDFDALGLSFEERVALFEETIGILRLAQIGPIEHSGKQFHITSPISIDPPPPAGLQIWYGGTSSAAMRRAWTFADGILAGRLPLTTFMTRMRLLEELREDSKRHFEVATIPITLLSSDRDTVRREVAPAVQVLGESSETAKTWVRPPSGQFDTIEDLSGLLIVGDADDCLTEISKLVRIGVDHVIFDFRLAFDRSREMIHLIRTGVMPNLVVPG